MTKEPEKEYVVIDSDNSLSNQSKKFDMALNNFLKVIAEESGLIRLIDWLTKWLIVKSEKRS